MSRLKYHQQLSRLVTHSLLHLLSQMAIDTRFWPLKKRNASLQRYLKSQLTSPKYDRLKKDIKQMISIAKKNGELEAKLYELDDMNKEYEKKFTQADQLFVLLTYLYDEHGFESKIEDGKIKEKGIIYMKQPDIERCFDESNQLIESLPFVINMPKPLLLVDFIHNHGAFHATLASIDDNDEATIMLRRPHS
ncbi:DUF2913 family protein [Vibrio algicola]|uniref:DUF2913 family protein n=1 Tax=Vibrio algicola TaxID=2662262 RepID=UPI0015B5BBE1|nr:DUF2913 family protein [Vibrio algicola]